LGRAELARWLAYPMTILAGDQDIAQGDPNLPANPEALAQGPHRFGRSQYMLDFARAEAERLGLPCNWTRIVVAGVGHDGAAMSRATAGLWFEGGLPSPEVLQPGAPQQRW
ncbi:MAG: alpha/beta hydrolase, partial [Allorhizobium sp.]